MFFRAPQTIAFAKECFMCIHNECVKAHPPASGAAPGAPESVNVRKLVSSYMIWNHSGRVFEDKNEPLEKALLAKAGMWIDSVEALQNALMSSDDVDVPNVFRIHGSRFHADTVDYLHAFEVSGYPGFHADTLDYLHAFGGI